MRLSLFLLGSFEASCDVEPVTFATHAARALLAYLVVEADRPHRREFLATLLWPDQPQAAAFTNLRQTVARVRQALPAPVTTELLQVTRQTLAVQPNGADVDVARFEELIAACADHTHGDMIRCRACIQRLEQACALYRGEFLDGVFPGGSQLFEEWVFLRREQLHRQALDALHTLANHYELVADYELMRRSAARQLALEPLREAAHRQMMRALALLHSRSAALDQYETCRQVLAVELGVEPDVETRALYERIRNDELASETLRAPLPEHNLPTQLTPRVGRERELRDLNALLDSHAVRLLTIVGAGGMGKTRLAIELAYQRLNQYRDGVFFVALAPVAAPDAIVAAIATAMGLALHGDLRQALPSTLRNKEVLVILDNIEHLLDGARIVVELLEAAPQLRVVVTSRERLNVLGEQVYTLTGLDYEASSVDGALTASAVRLFTNSARRVLPSFTVTGDNLAAVTQICEITQGMPLGLELAATWVDMLPLDEIAAEIERNLDFLSAEWRDVPERHRSLRAVFDGSWRGLDEHERVVFRQLSVFRGGFSRAAAQAITGTSMRTLVRLAYKSLLDQQGGHGGEVRYRIHELLRQFGAEQLDRSPDEYAAVEQRHCAYYLAFVAQREIALDGDAPQRAAFQIGTEIDNIKQAWTTAATQGWLTELSRGAFGLWRFCSLTGQNTEAERLLGLAVEQLEAQLVLENTRHVADVQELTRALSVMRALHALTLVSLGEYDHVIPVARRAVELGRTSGEAVGEAYGWLAEGQALMHKAQYAEASNRLEEVLRVSRNHATSPRAVSPFQLMEWLVHLWLGATAVRVGDDDRARRLIGQSLEICRQHGNLRGEMTCLTNLADAARSARDCAAAREYYVDALRLARRLDYRWGDAIVQQELGDIARLQGDPELARQLTDGALALFREIGDRPREAMCLGYLGRLHCYLGDSSGAQAYLSRFLHVIEGLDAPLSEIPGWVALAILSHSTGEAEQALVYAHRAEQLALAVGSAVDQADALVIIGHALAQMSRIDEASTAYRRAIALCAGLVRPPEVMAARGGLVRLVLAQGDSKQAFAHVESMLDVLDVEGERVGDQPFDLYLTCYSALDAVDDARVVTVLQTAHDKLLEYADRILNDALRRMFLEDVPAHRELRLAHAARLTSFVSTATPSS